MLQIGPYEIHALETGKFRLDGGAMFGVVPRVLWEKAARPDALNRIQLSMRTLVAIDRSAQRVILVDTGAGDKWDSSEIERFAFELGDDLLGSGLRALGITDQEVTDVVVTHLHFDHNGGLTRVSDTSTGKLVPRFPNARHWIHALHLQHASAPTLKDRASFYARDFEPLLQGDLLELLEGEAPASTIPHLSWLVVHGHTPYQLLPCLYEDSVNLQYLGDLIPTAAHLPLPWVMAYDNNPLHTIREKEALYQACSARDTVVFFEHDPHIAAARLELGAKKPLIKERVL